MANNQSAIKRIGINKRNRLQNRFYKSSVRTITKMFLKRIENYNISKNPEDKYQAQVLLSTLYSLIDKASKKNVFHKNNAARKKSQLALKLKTI
jgi:small subunit ribosomal protein S20|uniref:Small ribosomal subunit protein bS20c n=1 Tax=Coscinodiscus granii TaxID=265552 RepID=A0A8A6KM37_9STRA|nr:ribosomal protein S20 [Coscinodiscus granii]QTI83002.1 ribosomal protein S20 [Coscinodiscus granii]